MGTCEDTGSPPFGYRGGANGSHWCHTAVVICPRFVAILNVRNLEPIWVARLDILSTLLQVAHGHSNRDGGDMGILAITLPCGCHCFFASRAHFEAALYI